MNLFIKECQEANKDYELKQCFDTETFMETLNRGSLFDSSKKIAVLMGLSDDNLQEIESYVNYETEDIIILVESLGISKNKAYARIKGEFSYQKLENVSDRECRGWLHTYMLKEGLKFTPEIPAYIIKKRGTDAAPAPPPSPRR